MHAGNAFASLMAWLAARSEGGRMVLRIEDLDERCQNRSVAETLVDDLAWMGIDWDEGPFWQSERRDIYAEELAQLEAQGLCYPCFCSRADLHAATAPHASDGTYVYQGTCRGLSPEEVAARPSARRRRALRWAMRSSRLTMRCSGPSMRCSRAIAATSWCAEQMGSMHTSWHAR